VPILLALGFAGCWSGEPGGGVNDAIPGAPVVDGPGRYAGEFESGDAVRRYILHVPESPADPAPLVLVLHGFTGNPEQAEELTAMHELGEREGFVTVYPAARGLIPAWRADRGSRDGADVQFVRDLVDVIGAAVPVDSDRVYATGMSNGGGMVDRLACEAADVVAAVAPVAGAYSYGDCEPVRPVPILAFHGTADWIVPIRGFGWLLPPVPEWAARWAERNECGDVSSPRPAGSDVVVYGWQTCAADVLLYVVDGGGHGWPGSRQAAASGNSTTSVSASEIIWEFFAAHPMG
jgi:polyhydroxybutyrate depolymerase